MADEPGGLLRRLKRAVAAYEAPWPVVGVALAVVVVLLVALGRVAPDLPRAQRATGASVVGLVTPDADADALQRGLVVDGVLIAAYVLFGLLVLSRFWVTARDRTTRRRHPGALVGSALVLGAGLADAVENSVLAYVISEKGSVRNGLLGVMRGAGLAKLLLLATAVMALVILLLTRERRDYTVGHPANRPTPENDGERPDWDPPRPSPGGRGGRTGVCLSGGGIRSAAFSLGGLQALQDAHVLERAEYLAAASGGGYLAAGWAVSAAEEPAGSTRTPWSRGSPEERWFRDHSSYLVPDMLGGLRGVGRLLGGVAFNVLLIWLLLFVIARPVGWIVSAAHPELKAVQPVALPRDAKGEMVIGETVTPAGTLEVVVDGAVVQAQRYQIDLVPNPEGSRNQVCFDARPFNPSHRDHCFDVVTSRPITVDVRAGTVDVMRQPRVKASTPDCPTPGLRGPNAMTVTPVPRKPPAGQPLRCQVFDRIEVLSQPQVSLRETTVTAIESLPNQLEISRQPVLRTKTGLVGRPEPAYRWWMGEAILFPLAAAALIGLVMMTLRTKGPVHEAARFAAVTFALTGLACLVVLVLLPVLIDWLPTVGQRDLSLSDWQLGDYWLPSGGLLALAIASARQFLSANRAGKGTGPAKPSKPEAPTGIVSRMWAWLTKGRQQLGWYELSPLKVLLSLLLLLGFVVFLVAQLQYASANGLTGNLMGIGFVRSHLPFWLWWPEWVKWLGVVALLGVVAVSMDAHSWSLYPFYKRALSSAFLVRTKAIGYDQLIPLTSDPATEWPGLAGSQGPDDKRQPKLILCCAVNLSEYGMVPPGRRAASFTFGPDFIGGPIVGYQPTHEFWENLPASRRRDITLPSAMAISGAAFSPAMGKKNLGAVGSLLAIANLRLGVWLPHPQRATWENRKRWGNVFRPGWLWFLREVTNTYKFQRRYLYVSDGGHWDNLGLVELLRRGCTEIICISAAGDGAIGFGTISEAMALAREELGVEWVGFDPTPVRPPTKAADPKPARELRRPGTTETAEPFAPKPFARGKYRFPDGTLGDLTYIETALTADMPFDVHGFAESAAIFPDDSTADQVFNHRQFESFRALGYHQVSAALTS